MSLTEIPLDVLAVAPHPDDAELFCGGTLALLARRGARVGVLDLSRGEAASRGTPEIRAREAEAAAEVLGLAHRCNLELPDGALVVTEVAVRRLVAVLRTHRPEWVMGPPRLARHPDHEVAGELVRRAVMLAGVGGFRAGPGLERHLVSYSSQYIMRHQLPPSFLVDITSVYEVKARAIACHQSQFQDTGPTTLGAAPGALAALDARDRFHGAQIGVGAAEPHRIERALGTDDPLGFMRAHAGAPAFFFSGDGP